MSSSAFAFVISASCAGPVFDPFDIPQLTGIYLLESLDGTALPQPVANVLACPVGRMSGELRVDPGGVDFLPRYRWSMCLVPGAPADLTDAGYWSGSIDRLSFRSERGRGTYQAQPGGATTGGPVTVSFLQDGHTFVFRLVRRNDAPIGVLRVSVVDELGNWVNGAGLLFITGDGLPDGGTTNNDRAFGGGGAVGLWTVTVTPPAGYTVPPSQPNPVSIQVPASPTATDVTLLTIVLRRTS